MVKLLGMGGMLLRRLPNSARVLLTLALLSFAMNHLTSAMLIWEVTTHVSSSAKEHFAYKTKANLLRMLHQHAFGHGTMYFLVGLLFLFTPWPEKMKIALVALPFLGAWLDQAGWVGLKYGSEGWEWISFVGGWTYALSFFTMSLLIFWETWFARTATRNE